MSNASDSHNFSVILNAVLGFCKYFVRVSIVDNSIIISKQASLDMLIWEFKIVLMDILSRVKIFLWGTKVFNTSIYLLTNLNGL